MISEVEKFNFRSISQKLAFRRNLLLVVAFFLSCFNMSCFWVLKKYQERDVYYSISENPRYFVRSQDSGHQKWEAENFSARLVNKMLTHAQGTFESDMEEVFSMTSLEVALKIYDILEQEGIKRIYMEEGGIGEMEITKIVCNCEKVPFSTLLAYRLVVRPFRGRGKALTLIGEIYLNLLPVPRAKTNPYGLKCINVVFLKPKKKKNLKTKNNF